MKQHILLAALCSGLVAACGGGGGSHDDTDGGEGGGEVGNALTAVWDEASEVIELRGDVLASADVSVGDPQCAQQPGVFEWGANSGGQYAFRVPHINSIGSNWCDITVTDAAGAQKITFDLRALGAANMLRLRGDDTHDVKITYAYEGATDNLQDCDVETFAYERQGKRYGSAVWGFIDPVDRKTDYARGGQCFTLFIDGVDAAAGSWTHMQTTWAHGLRIVTERDLNSLRSERATHTGTNWDDSSYEYAIEAARHEILDHNRYRQEIAITGTTTPSARLVQRTTVEFDVPRASVVLPKLADYSFRYTAYNAFDGTCNGAGGSFGVYSNGTFKGVVAAGERLTFDVRGGEHVVGLDWMSQGQVTNVAPYLHDSWGWHWWGCNDGSWPGSPKHATQAAQQAANASRQRIEAMSGALQTPFPAGSTFNSRQPGGL